MNRTVEIVGVGWSGFRSITPDLSYKELVYEAATRAYADAGIDPRRDVNGFVTAAEDYHEGTSIFDEYTPDQLGGALRPMHTIGGDGLHALAAAYMQIASGLMEVAVVEAHSKASNVLTLPEITAFAEDPTYERPLGLHPATLAGLEMQWLVSHGVLSAEQCAAVTVKNKRHALANPAAAHGATIGVEDVLRADMLAAPLTRLMAAPHADGAIVFVLASSEAARGLKGKAVRVRGVGWANDTPALDSRAWGEARYARLAGEMAYRIAGIQAPQQEVDFAEVDDTFAHKELLHLEALGLMAAGTAGRETLRGATSLGGSLPVNISGGSSGRGRTAGCDRSGTCAGGGAAIARRGRVAAVGGRAHGSGICLARPAHHQRGGGHS